MRRLTGSIGAAALTAALTLGASAASAAEIGVVASNQPMMRGQPPQATERDLSVGAQVFQNERIRTSRTGRGQLLFNDQTALSIAPRSSIVLNQFVYNPSQRRGAMALNLTRGALRFIGGAITERNEAVVTTPIASTGVRGGMAILAYEQVDGLIAVLVAGEYLRITASGETLVLSRENAVARVPAGGGAPEFVGLASQQSLNNLFSLFEGAGAGPNPTDSQLAGSGIGSTGAGELGGPRRDRVTTKGGAEADFGFDDISPANRRFQILEVDPGTLAAPITIIVRP